VAAADRAHAQDAEAVEAGHEADHQEQADREGDLQGDLAAQEEFRVYILNLKLADPAAAPAFAREHNPPPNAPQGTRQSDPPPPLLQAWQDIREASGNLVKNQRRVLLTGAWLLSLLAVASVALLVGGRMAAQIRRVGLLKAVGGTPGLVAAVLLPSTSSWPCSRRWPDSRSAG
jgi:hypothetical protein